MEYKNGLGLIGIRSGIRNRNEEIKRLYSDGKFNGVELAKKFNISKVLVYQVISGRRLYCVVCSKELNKENAQNTRKCKNCWEESRLKMLNEQKERKDAIHAVMEEKRKARLDTHLLKLQQVKEKKERMVEMIEADCFACKKHFKAARHRFKGKYKIFCHECRKHLFLNDSLSGGRDRTREIRRMWDNYSCQDCGVKWRLGQRRFDVHHLNGMCGKKSTGYDSYEALPELTTLCHRCHLSKHASLKGTKLSLADRKIRNVEIKRLLTNNIKTRQEVADWYGFKKSNLAHLTI